ncbi:metallophosphoesterase family protein [Tundrisphaera sp. TA3]|uniref:metallophosphoesterase family protein n=1 Tax=Tundrisphaera sp. TA3 TaxID=3435775 RepID=UPI003EBC9D30
MRVGILSDTHDKVERTRTAVELLRSEGAEALIHCGDLTTPPIVEILACLPAWFVLGNNDEGRAPHLERAAAASGVACLGRGGVIELGGARLGVAHGHLARDLRRVLADRPDYLLTGHSHVASDGMAGSVRRINPGALHRASAFTVALLDTEGGDLRFLHVPK